MYANHVQLLWDRGSKITTTKKKSLEIHLLGNYLSTVNLSLLIINQITWIILLNSSKEDLHSIQYLVANCWIALWTLLLGTLAVLLSSCNRIQCLLIYCHITYKVIRCWNIINWKETILEKGFHMVIKINNLKYWFQLLQKEIIFMNYCP